MGGKVGSGAYYEGTDAVVLGLFLIGMAAFLGYRGWLFLNDED